MRKNTPVMRHPLVRILAVLASLPAAEVSWSYPHAHSLHMWMQMTACQDPKCKIPPAPTNESTTHPTIQVIQNETITLSWNVTGATRPADGGVSSRSFIQVVKHSADLKECTDTLLGRRSFIVDHCTGRPQTECISGALPCAWNNGTEKRCEAALNNSLSYAGALSYKVPDEVGKYKIRMFAQVQCPTDASKRNCSEVAAEKPDTIVLNGTMVGRSNSADMRTAIAAVAGEPVERVQSVILGPSVANNPFSISAVIFPTTLNRTLQAETAQRLTNARGFTEAVKTATQSFFDDRQTTMFASLQLGAAPCWKIQHTLEVEVKEPSCVQACLHGTCTLTDTCTCDPGWKHSLKALDCALPICSNTNRTGCEDGCCNNGTCTAPLTCSCTDRWSGSDCTLAVCPPTWNETKLKAFKPEQGSACENDGVCTYTGTRNTCTCSSAWEGDGCQLNVDECGATWVQKQPCSKHSTCLDISGGYNCTCLPDYIGDGVWCHPAGNVTLKVYQHKWTDVHTVNTVADVAFALGIPQSSITPIQALNAGSFAFVSVAFGLVPTTPWVTPQDLIGALQKQVSSSDGITRILGPNKLLFDKVYGVEASVYRPPAPPLPTQIKLKLNGQWSADLANTSLPARHEFKEKFANSAGVLLKVDPARINVTNVTSGSIIVSFVIAEPNVTNGTSVVMSASSALTSFRYLMSKCSVKTPSKCPKFDGMAALGYVEETSNSSSSGAAAADGVDSDTDNELNEVVQCYSSAKKVGRCLTRFCVSDADCQGLPGLGDPALAFCAAHGVCDDGLAGEVKGAKVGAGGARRVVATMMQVVTCLAVLTAFR